MRRIGLVFAILSIVVVGASAPRALSVSASGHSHSVVNQKKCKRGQHRVHGMCKKKHGAPPTPVPTAVPGLFDHPDDVALDAQGNIYVTEGLGGLTSRVLKLSPTGQLLATLGTEGTGSGQFRFPTGVALDAQGDLYVADYLNDRIQKLSPTGQVLLVWGSTGAGPGQFNGPHSIALDAQGNVYVTDFGNLDGSIADNRIQKFSPTGQQLAVWGTAGSGPGQLVNPTGIAVDAQGNIFVAEQSNHRIQKLSPNGQPIAVWGKVGTEPGQFDIPRGIALDAQGNLYVADRGLNRIQKFSPTGKVLTVWDSKELGLSGNSPFDVALDVQGNVYVTDHEHSRILKLSPSGAVLATFQ